MFEMMLDENHRVAPTQRKPIFVPRPRLFRYAAIAVLALVFLGLLDSPARAQQGCCWYCLGNSVVCSAPSTQATCTHNFSAGGNCGTAACGFGSCGGVLAPTLSTWAVVAVTLLLLTAGSIVLGRRRSALTNAGPVTLNMLASRPPFVLSVFRKSLAGTFAAVFLALAGLHWLGEELAAVDIGGALVCTPIFAYLVHLWLANLIGDHR